jgi:hypothetical protein
MTLKPQKPAKTVKTSPGVSDTRLNISFGLSTDAMY